ncbi:MAG: SMC-Scp complex subunit ScpB [Acutalibacteraceae bacterium]
MPKGWEWIRLPCARHWNGSGRLAGAGLPFELLELEENVQLATAEEYGELIRSVLSQKRSTPLSQSAMEVLAIIAYNQPVTRAFVEQIRGVDSSSAVNSLVVRDLVEEAGRLELPGRPIAYRTTANFLRCFGLQSLDELPDITRGGPGTGAAGAALPDPGRRTGGRAVKWLLLIPVLLVVLLWLPLSVRVRYNSRLTVWAGVGSHCWPGCMRPPGNPWNRPSRNPSRSRTHQRKRRKRNPCSRRR